MNYRSTPFGLVSLLLVAGMVCSGPSVSASYATNGQHGNALPGEPFELHDGDRVVFLGGTFLERAQEFGYLEAALTTRWPARNVTFRNIAWSGDTPAGAARGHYTNPPTAYEHLIDQVAGARPTVLFIQYGAPLAYEGPGAVDRFREEMSGLLGDLADTTEARIVLLSPPPHEPSTSPADAETYNERLRAGARAIEAMAAERGLRHVDLLGGLGELIEQTSRPLTTNGIYYNASGYYYAAALLEEGLGWGPRTWAAALEVSSGRARADGAEVNIEQLDEGPAAFRMRPARLTLPFPGKEASARALGKGRLTIEGLGEGRYRLLEGERPVAEASAEAWASGLQVDLPAAAAQAERLRGAIVQKNRFYFYKYRPQNETYLVGFRAYEQGQNADELEQFETLIDEKELEIGYLRRPEARRYRLVPADEN